jgi:hypothetical protein
MLGGGEHVEPGVVGQDGQLAHLVEHLLVTLVIAPDRAELLSLLERTGDCGQDEEHELHRPPPRLWAKARPTALLRSRRRADCEASL